MGNSEVQAAAAVCKQRRNSLTETLRMRSSHRTAHTRCCLLPSSDTKRCYEKYTNQTSYKEFSLNCFGPCHCRNYQNQPIDRLKLVSKIYIKCYKMVRIGQNITVLYMLAIALSPFIPGSVVVNLKPSSQSSAA